MREKRPGVWELVVTAGRYSDGTSRRVYRTISRTTRAQAARELAALIAEVGDTSMPVEPAARHLTVDEAVEAFLTEHLIREKGREERTVDGYRQVYRRWFQPHIGARRLAEIDLATMDRIFGQMHRAGLSRSRMNQARALWAPLFRWARKRRMVHNNPLVDFELPTSKQVPRDRVPPEVAELSFLLAEAVMVVPDVASLLVLGAVTGMRRGELASLRRSDIDAELLEIKVASATDRMGRPKTTKTRRRRTVQIDAATAEMLARHMQEMNERAAALGVDIADDAFVFSESADCSKAYAPDRITKRVAVLKEHLGIEEKNPDTIRLEEQALAMYRLPRRKRHAGQPGGIPAGGRSYAEIGRELGRSPKWVMLAVRSAERREQAAARGLKLDFDGSILALRKFTSSELLDAGFNLSMVAQRQGHGPGVLVKHYARSRRSSDRRAAEHLGRIIHGEPTGAPAT